MLYPTEVYRWCLRWATYPTECIGGACDGQAEEGNQQREEQPSHPPSPGKASPFLSIDAAHTLLAWTQTHSLCNLIIMSLCLFSQTSRGPRHHTCTTHPQDREKVSS